MEPRALQLVGSHEKSSVIRANRLRRKACFLCVHEFDACKRDREKTEVPLVHAPWNEKSELGDYP